MRSRAISLAGFEDKFAANSDPWRTRSSAYERRKRDDLSHVVGPGRHGRVLEVAAGNGSNTPMLSCRALRLTVTEGTSSGVHLIRRVVQDEARIDVHQLDLAEHLPGRRYDMVVVSEVLYYLPDRTFSSFAGEVSRTLRPGGSLILAHNKRYYPDAHRDGSKVHCQLLREMKVRMVPAYRCSTRHYSIERFIRQGTALSAPA